jgi:Domain of unknown function (DUF4351)/Putative transposase, YhgA-like
MIDHDRLFKELLETFFWEFLELFLPEVLEYVSRDSLIFLPQEVFTDVTFGEKKEIDLLAQVKFRGENRVFLIHIENQSYTQPEFERRMFHYFARLDEKYQLPIYPVVVFSFDEPKRPEKNQYLVNFPDKKVLEFNYVAIQLNRLNWRKFLNKPSPVTAALMAKMEFKPEDRPKVKLECLRMLATLKLDPARIELISGFVDTYLRLNDREEQSLQTELKQAGLVEEEKVMEIVTSWMEKGIETGEKGLVIRLLNRCFGSISNDLQQQINGLSIQKIEQLADSLLDFKSETDLINWLNQNSNN